MERPQGVETETDAEAEAETDAGTEAETEAETPVADLHVHTTASDGQLEMSELPRVARAAGIECVAVTDHDRPHPELDAPVVQRDGVTMIRGIELRVDAGRVNVDLLGYGVRETDALIAAVDRIQRDRVRRARRMIECVESRLDVDLDLDPMPGIGRPHVAHAIEASSAPYAYQEAFDHLIGSRCPCYVPREIPSFERGVELLSESCSIVSLAHPFRYRDPAAALELTADLDAVERYYPYGRDVDVGRLDRLIEDRDLLVTGGSDAHGTTVGGTGMPRDAFERVREALTAA